MSIENTSRHKAQASETNNNQIERSFAEFDPTYDPQNNTESVEQKSLFPGHITVSPTGYDKTPIGQAIEDGHITMVSSDQINDDPTVHFDDEHRYYENPTATPASATPEVTPAEKKKLSTGKKVGMGAAGIAALSVVIPVSDYVEKKFFEKSVELQFEAIAGQEIPNFDAPGIDLGNNTAVIEAAPTEATEESTYVYNPDDIPMEDRYSYGEGATPELELMDLNYYVNGVAYEDRVEYAQNLVEPLLEDARTELNSELSDKGVAEIGSITKMTVNSTAKEIADYNAAVDYIVTTKLTELQAMKVRASMMKGTAPGFEGKVAAVDQPVISNLDIISETPVFYNTKFNYTDPNGTPTKVSQAKNLVDGNISQIVYQFVQSVDGNSGNWLIVDIAGSNNGNEWKDILDQVPVQ